MSAEIDDTRFAIGRLLAKLDLELTVAPSEVVVTRLEAEIIRRGLLADYAGHVMDILGVQCYGSGWDGVAWADVSEIGQVLTASLDVRVQAMLAVLEVAP